MNKEKMQQASKLLNQIETIEDMLTRQLKLLPKKEELEDSEINRMRMSEHFLHVRLVKESEHIYTKDRAIPIPTEHVMPIMKAAQEYWINRLTELKKEFEEL